MADLEEMENRRRWAERYQMIAIQANNMTKYLNDPELDTKEADLQVFGQLTTEFGASIESMLVHLYDLAGITYGVHPQQFMMMGGFRHLKKHNDNPNYHHDNEEGQWPTT